MRCMSASTTCRSRASGTSRPSSQSAAKALRPSGSGDGCSSATASRCAGANGCRRDQVHKTATRINTPASISMATKANLRIRTPHFLPDRHCSGAANVVHPSHAHTTYPWAATGGTMRDTLSDESGKTLLPEITGYTLLRAIGHGGMSTVYLGEQVSLSRQVAIKVMLRSEEHTSRLNSSH